jgi:hypothetical protein
VRVPRAQSTLPGGRGCPCPLAAAPTTLRGRPGARTRSSRAAGARGSPRPLAVAGERTSTRATTAGAGGGARGSRGPLKAAGAVASVLTGTAPLCALASGRSLTRGRRLATTSITVAYRPVRTSAARPGTIAGGPRPSVIGIGAGTAPRAVEASSPAGPGAAFAPLVGAMTVGAMTVAARPAAPGQLGGDPRGDGTLQQLYTAGIFALGLTGRYDRNNGDPLDAELRFRAHDITGFGAVVNK